MRIGVDLGGTKLEAVAMDAQGTIRLRRRVATPQTNYAATVRTVRDLVLEIEAEVGETCTVGIGTPGGRARDMQPRRSLESLKCCQCLCFQFHRHATCSDPAARSPAPRGTKVISRNITEQSGPFEISNHT